MDTASGSLESNGEEGQVEAATGHAFGGSKANLVAATSICAAWRKVWSSPSASPTSPLRRLLYTSPSPRDSTSS
eukprot:12358892-Prorocentrum_lima.AAC.1